MIAAEIESQISTAKRAGFTARQMLDNLDKRADQTCRFIAEAIKCGSLGCEQRLEKLLQEARDMQQTRKVVLDLAFKEAGQ